MLGISVLYLGDEIAAHGSITLGVARFFSRSALGMLPLKQG